MATQAKTKRINVSEEEVAKFNELAHKWWDKTSEFKPLHDINPLRLNFIHEKINLAMEKFDDRVDSYIEKSATFAQEILKHIRSLVHQASPLISETIKWGFPHFVHKGSICHMAAFKGHCTFQIGVSTSHTDVSSGIRYTIISGNFYW